MGGAGAQDREVEIKLELEEKTYDVLMARFASGRKPVLQENIFLDTEDRTLGAGRWALRIRKEPGRFLLTVKGERTRDAGGLFSREERETEIPPARAERMLEGFRLSEAPEAPCAALLRRFGDLRVRPFLRFVNHRTAMRRGPWALELDRTEVGRTRFCELELEVDAGQAPEAAEYLRGWFREEGWAYRPSEKSKLERALEAEEAGRPRGPRTR